MANVGKTSLRQRSSQKKVRKEHKTKENTGSENPLYPVKKELHSEDNHR